MSFEQNETDLRNQQTYDRLKTNGPNVVNQVETFMEKSNQLHADVAGDAVKQGEVQALQDQFITLVTNKLTPNISNRSVTADPAP